MDVTAVILNYQRPDDTITCLHSLIAAGIPKERVIVIDNHSPDDSVQRISSVFPDIEIRTTEENGGYTGGMNFGMAIALERSTELILVTNSDVVIHKDAVRTLSSALERSAAAGVAVPSIYHFDTPDRLWYNGGSVGRIRSSGFPSPAPAAVSDNAGVIEVGFFTGCSFLIRASALRQVGGFDERYFMYQEDVDLSHRMTQKKFRILYVPDARIDHKVNEGRIKPMPLYYSMRNRLLFTSVHLRGAERFMSFAYLYSVIIVKMLFWSLSQPPLVAALRCAIADFRLGRFGRRIAPIAAVVWTAFAGVVSAMYNVL